MKQNLFLGLAVALVTIGLGLGAAAQAATSFDKQLTLDSDGEPILIKQGHKLYSVMVDPDHEDTINVYRTNKTVDDATDITDNNRWADLTADTLNITAQYGYHQYLYLATKNSSDEAQLWRAPLNGRGKWTQVGIDAFDSDVQTITSFAKRRTSQYQDQVRAHGGVKNTLFVAVKTADGNALYRTTNGTEWTQVEVDATFTDGSDNPVVGFAHHSADSTRYLYAVLEDGSIIRADAADMTVWEDVLTITPTPVDADATNPTLTVTDIARNGSNLYVIGAVAGDESQSGALFMSTDWATAEQIYSADQGNGFVGLLKKPQLQGPLLMLAYTSDDWMNISQVNTDGTLDALVPAEGDDSWDDAGIYLTSLLHYRDTIYVGAYKSDSWIYTLSL